jgi:hypothetical protein
MHPLTPLAHLSLLSLLSPLSPAAEIPLQPLPDSAHQLDLQQLPDRRWSLLTTGNDPHLSLAPTNQGEAFDPASSPLGWVFEVDLICPPGTPDVELFPGPPFHAATRIEAPNIPPSQDWIPYIVDLGTTADWTQLRWDPSMAKGIPIELRNPRLRPPSDAELAARDASARLRESRAQAAADLLADWHRASLPPAEGGFPIQFTSIALSHDTITLKGIFHQALHAAQLVELLPHHQPWPAPTTWPEPTSPIQPDADGAFSLTLPRHHQRRDRLSSAWRVLAPIPDTGTLAPASPRSWPTQIASASDAPAPPLPDSFKGITDPGPREALPDLLELGIRHININVPLVALIAASPDAAAGHHTFGEVAFPIHAGQLERLDHTLAFCREHDISASAILLVQPTAAPHAAALVHPDFSGHGHYTMPNLAEPAGAALYAAVLDLLASRYASPDSPHGWFRNWIVHNEIDHGWIWTNMGEHPLPTYLDTYLRSLRLCHALIRSRSPHPRTFIPLTHQWTAGDDPGLRSYSPRQIIDLTAQVTAAEGDFDWGVAYHPYPRNLFQPRTWQDPDTTADFDTPFITLRNIDVLTRYLDQPHLHFAGQARPLLLSEQGFHTAADDPDAQAAQATALAFAWHQLRSLPPGQRPEAFHYHRWQDHPKEGGLLLGLRSFPSPDHPHGTPKQGYHLYQNLDTASEPDLSTLLPQQPAP